MVCFGGGVGVWDVGCGGGMWEVGLGALLPKL